MAEQADEADRLEAALDRIARASVPAPNGCPDAPAVADVVDHAALVARLDALIVELRTILGQS